MTWLAGWGHRKSHVVTHQDGSGTDYQVIIKVYKITGTDNTEAIGDWTSGKVYVGSNCRDDFGDIRFTGTDGSSQLDYWMDPDLLVSGTSAVFWVEIGDDLTSVDRTIYVYYSKPDATDASNGTNTFLQDLFFAGSLTGWTEQDPNSRISADGTKLNYSGLDRNETAYVCKAATITAFRVRWKWSMSVFNANHTHEEIVNARLADDCKANAYQYGSDNESQNYLYFRRKVNGVDGYASALSWVLNTTYWDEYVVIGSPLTLARKLFSNATRSTQVGSTQTLDLSGVTSCAYFHILQASDDAADGGRTGTGWITNVHVTKYVSPEPAHSTWGSEENNPLTMGKLFLVDKDNNLFRIDPSSLIEEKTISVA